MSQSDSRSRFGQRDRILPQSPQADGPPLFADGLFVRPILDADDPQKISFVRTVDARTALARGLAEYMSMLSMIWEGGRELKFKKTNFYWAEPEEEGLLPAAAAIGYAPAKYSDVSTSQHLFQVDDGTGRYLQMSAGVVQDFDLELWSTDPVELYGLAAMVEDALEPAEYMTGLRLELPYYFNQRAIYLKSAIRYGANKADAQTRWRKAIFTVTGEVPQMVPVGVLKIMDPRITTTVSDEPLTQQKK